MYSLGIISNLETRAEAVRVEYISLQYTASVPASSQGIHQSNVVE